MAHAKKKTAADVQSDADHGQDIRIDVPHGEPAHQGINNSLSSASDTSPKHVSGYVSPRSRDVIMPENRRKSTDYTETLPFRTRRQLVVQSPQLPDLEIARARRSTHDDF